MMNADDIKLMCDSLIDPDDRNYTVRIDQRPARYAGTYRLSKREVVLYPNCPSLDKGNWNLIGAALHEVAHHIIRKNLSRFLTPHGPQFCQVLDEITALWNFRYREIVAGYLDFDPDRPTRAPSFKRFERRADKVAKGQR